MTRERFRRSPAYEPYRLERQQFYADTAHNTAENECLRARRCMLVPYTPTRDEPGCCDQKRQTGHHLVEASAFYDVGRGGSSSTPRAGCDRYHQGRAPSVCVEGTDHGTGTHGQMHDFQSDEALRCPGGMTTYGAARDSGARAVTEVFPESNCSEECIKSQMDHYHKDECQIDDSTPIEAVATTTSPDVAAERERVWRNKGHLFA